MKTRTEPRFSVGPTRSPYLDSSSPHLRVLPNPHAKCESLDKRMGHPGPLDLHWSRAGIWSSDYPRALLCSRTGKRATQTIRLPPPEQHVRQRQRHGPRSSEFEPRKIFTREGLRLRVKVQFSVPFDCQTARGFPSPMQIQGKPDKQRSQDKQLVFWFGPLIDIRRPPYQLTQRHIALINIGGRR